MGKKKVLVEVEETEKEEFKGAFFKSNQAGKFDRVLFEKANDIIFVEDERHAELLRNHHFFKRGILTEHTEKEVAELKKEALKKQGLGGTDPEDFEARVQYEVERRLGSLNKRGKGVDEASEIEAAKAYLDKHEIKYHPNTGLEKLVAKVAEHQGAEK